MRNTLVLMIMSVLAFSWAIDMPAQTEQYYVVQGIFNDLGISQHDCNVADDVLNFACGSYSDSIDNFKLAVDRHIQNNLPGLFLYRDWFMNDSAQVKQYQSLQGRYYIGIHPNNTVIVIFEPF